MFSMTSLESRNSPLRTFQTFYQPINRPHSRSVKKTFPNIAKHSEIAELYNPTSAINKKDLSTSTNSCYEEKYLDCLERNKNLQRRNKHRGELDAYLSFRRHDNPQSHNASSVMSKQQSIMSQQKSIMSNQQSIMSNQQSIMSLKLPSFGVSRVSSLCSILDKKQQNSFKKRWHQFQTQNTGREQESKEQLRFTFYNNHEKSKSIMEKYRKDQSLEKRGTNEYQNIFNRTIAEDSLVKLLGQMDKKRRRGQVA